MLGLVLAFVLPGAALILRRVDRSRLLGALAAATLLVGSSYAVDKLYVRSFPDWHAFYAYDQVREQLHDAHRLSNLHNQIRRVGWSPNDQEMFAHWFFPDASIYSFEHIKFLVQNTPGTSQDPTGTLMDYLGTLRAPQIAPYLIFMLAIWLLEQTDAGSAAQSVTLTLPWFAAIGANLVLAWAYKDPTYVLVSTVGGSVVCSLVLLELSLAAQPGAMKPRSGAAPNARLWRWISMGLFVCGAGWLSAQVLQTSRINVAKQAAYEGILDNLRKLQATGRIEADALIVSPAHGLPYDWSYPFRLSLPPVAYFDTGWLTFSPTYDRIMQQFGIGSLPDALLRDDRLYLDDGVRLHAISCEVLPRARRHRGEGRHVVCDAQPARTCRLRWDLSLQAGCIAIASERGRRRGPQGGALVFRMWGLRPACIISRRSGMSERIT